MAQHLEALLQQQRLRNAQRAKLSSVSVFYQVWNDPLITVSQEQFIGQIITLCGAHNSFADLPTLTAQVNFESVLQRNPQVILLGGLTPVQDDWLKEWQKWPTLAAVAQQRIYPMHADTYQRPTARLIEGIEAFCNTVYQVP
jgi:iron complex transport system substrate-binding protein